jgi:NAD(P)-dependent dehydrogenase (short-subunit alcohol dehydrogenase family)
VPDTRDLTGRVALVTGAGGGVGGAVALELAARGASVVVNDLAVDVSGIGKGDTRPESTVTRIEAAGGTAVADGTSVADAGAVAAMVERTLGRFGRLDILVEPAGIVTGGPLDQVDQPAWDRLLDVHVGGHLNCLRAALPVMAAQGYGRILNVTSGAGLQRVAAGTTAYGTAKRAIAALTWALGAHPPAGVTINALSPIAATRMIARPGSPPAPAAPEGGSAASAPLDLSHMPPAEALAPVVAYLCGERTSWLCGQVVFTNGVEASLVAPPRLIESVHRGAWSADGGPGIGDVVGALVTASAQAGVTTGGSMPRLGGRPPRAGQAEVRGRALLVSSDRPAAAALGATLAAEGWRVAGAGPWDPPDGRLAEAVPVDFVGAERLLGAARRALGGVEALVVHSGEHDPGPDLSAAWNGAILTGIGRHAAWSRAAARAAPPGSPGMVTVHAVTSSAAGAVVAQAVCQLTRCLQSDRDPATFRTFTVEALPSDRPDRPALAELAAWLCRSPDAVALAAEELVAGDDWIGLRSHPAAAFTASFGRPVPEAWLDRALRAGLGDGEP